MSNEFVIYSHKIKKFLGPSDLSDIVYNDNCFVEDVKSANQYNRQANAQKLATQLFRQFKTVVVPIETTIKVRYDLMSSPKTVTSKLRALVKEFDNMSSDDADKLSKPELRRYVHAKRALEEL